MAATMFDFNLTRKKFVACIKQLEKEDDTYILQKCFNQQPGSESEKKSTLDQAFRDVLFEMVKNESDCETFKRLVTLATNAVAQDLLGAATPFIMLSEILDSIPLDKCTDVFSYIEERVPLWKSDTFYSGGKNYLLRMCNDLLRRLSKSQNTLFCGRIQLFLARLFPLTEKSGLNLTSQFNLDNVTVFNPKPEEYDKQRKQNQDGDRQEENMEIEEGEMKDHSNSIVVDYNLYMKFWSLQDYFRKPTQCYEKHPWKQFMNYTDNVLTCFDSYKLDDMKASRKKLEKLRSSQSQHSYFAKYLTSEKLLDLQLSDSNFRRYVLVQFLILFQYLNVPIKFKNSSQVLNEDQSNWVKKTQEKVYQLLKETPPDGDGFAKSIEHILSREENWSQWKNDGCPSYVREKSADNPIHRSRKRSIGEDLKTSGNKIVKMGNSELTRLWNLYPDNLSACSSKERQFQPSIEDFFKMAILQADPEQMVEDQYKLIHNKTWSWKAVRLMSRCNPHFFMQNQVAQQGQKVKTLPEYLDIMITKMAQELNQTGSRTSEEANDGEVGEEQTGVGGEDEHSEEPLDRPEEQESQHNTVDLLTKAHLEGVAEKLGGEWKKLATELNFPEEDIAYIESDTLDDAKVQALKMLTVWTENDPEAATVGTLRQALKEIGHASIAIDMFGAAED